MNVSIIPSKNEEGVVVTSFSTSKSKSAAAVGGGCKSSLLFPES
jgi:hypothetical protein